MEPHTSSYLNKYFVKLFRLHTWRRAGDYKFSFFSRMMYVRVLYELKSAVEPKRCLLDVRTSSLEVDLRVPGNRDEFPSVNSPRFVRTRGSSV